jgi:hypothetical protein
MYDQDNISCCKSRKLSFTKKICITSAMAFMYNFEIEEDKKKGRTIKSIKTYTKQTNTEYRYP